MNKAKIYSWERPFIRTTKDIWKDFMKNDFGVVVFAMIIIGALLLI